MSCCAADGSGVSKANPPASADLGIVLLHGWIQDLSAWLSTAQRLRDAHHADVLLVDFYAHGSSPELRGVRMHTVDALVMQVRRVVEHLGWNDRGIVLGAMSMGVSVALHYAHVFPRGIRGMLLVAPSGMPERWNPLPHVGARVSSALLGSDTGDEDSEPAGPARSGSLRGVRSFSRRSSVRQAESRRRMSARSTSVSRRLLSRLNFIKRTPSYGHSDDTFAILSHFKWPVTVVLARYDIVHTPQEEEWRAKAPHATILVTPMTHWWLCTHADDLHIEEYPIWQQTTAENDCAGGGDVALALRRRLGSASVGEPSLAGVSSLEEGLAILRTSRRRSRL